MPERAPRSRAGELLRHPAALWAAPALIYLFVRQLGLVVLGWLVDHQNSRQNTTMTVSGELGSWDGEWFLGIAEHGYNDVPMRLVDAAGKRSAETPLAFFPGYPALVRWVDGLPGVDVQGAAFAVSLISGLFCAYGLFVLGRAVRTGSSRAGLVLVTLFAASPMAVVLSMTYSEATFCAFAVWALVGVVRRQWVMAGVCCAGAGLVRPTAGALIAAVCLAALVAATWGGSRSARVSSTAGSACSNAAGARSSTAARRPGRSPCSTSANPARRWRSARSGCSSWRSSWSSTPSSAGWSGR
jgi:hypothetical protein